MLILTVAAAAAFYLFLHPYLFYPLSLTLFRPRPIRRSTSAPSRVTAVFSAYNEERSLPAKLANLRAIKTLMPDMELLAYCDLSTDRTREILESVPDVLTVVAATERTGKATGMARMVAQAQGEICIFTDANVMLEPGSIATLLDYFADPDVGGVAGSLHYINEDASTTARVGGLYWRLEEKLKELESRCGSIMGADGSIFATRRALYPEVPAHLLDDMTVSMAVPLGGHRLIYAPDVVALEKSATSSTDEFRRKRRIACRAFNTHRHLWPSIRARFGAGDIYKYVSHKLVRWFGLVWLVIAALAGGTALALAGQWPVLAGVIAFAALCLGLGHAGVPPFAMKFEILKSVVATFFGIVDSWRGMTYQTWAPAKSRD